MDVFRLGTARWGSDVLYSCPPKLVLAPDLKEILAGVKASGLPRVLRLWLGVIMVCSL